MQRCYGGVRLIEHGVCLENVARLDHGAVPMIRAMHKNGLQVDLSHFAKMEVELTRDMDRINEEVKQITGHYCNIDSGDQVAHLLFKVLGLKQARLKMTKSGKRESTEDEVLTAIQHDHPVIPKMLEYKEFSKLLGTYVKPMPKLAVKVGPDNWRMFPHLNQTRVPSGRLSCREPNLLAMPTRTERGRDVRKGYITKPGWKLVSVDECLHPSTLVETLLGPKKISELVIGEAVLTHRDRKIQYGRVTRKSPIRPKKAYRLTFDNGQSVIASHDHNWPTLQRIREGKTSGVIVKKTSELVIGERMVACRDGWSATQIANYFSLSYGYAGRLVKSIQEGSNHKLVSIEPIGIQPMYAITVEPDHNYVLSCGVVSQNSQIEVRIAAHRSKDPGLIRIYQQEEDIYSDFATGAFHLEDKRYKDKSGEWKYPTVDKNDHRRPAKTCVLAALYAVTAPGLLEQMPVVCGNCHKEATKHDCAKFVPVWTENKCQDLLNEMFLAYSGVLRMWKIDYANAMKDGYACGMWGRILHVAALRSVLEWVRNAALREVGNFPMQEGAQGTVKLAMAETMDNLIECGLTELAHPLLQVHDELLFECHNSVADDVAALVSYIFENCVRLDVPIKTGVAMSEESWGHLPK